MKPFFTYYGGKYRIAPHYPAPKHKTIIEPFAGAAGYSVRHYTHDVILVDASPIICGTWDYLISASQEEILNLPDIPHDLTVDDFDLIQEQRWLIGFWLNKASTGPRKSPGLWMRQGTRPNSHWGPAIRARLANQVEKIRHWKVIQGDYSASPSTEATWFIDPPYQKQGVLYPKKVDSFAELGSWCLERSGQVIVCEAEGADWLPFEPFREHKTVEGKRGGKRFREGIYYREC